MSFKWYYKSLLCTAGICLVGFAAVARAQLNQDGSAFVRELDEWREVCSFWVVETARVYPADSSELGQVKSQYITCAAVANSLIGQIQLDTLAKNKVARKRYQPHVKRAKSASETLAETGKRLLLAHPGSRGAKDPKSRGGGEEDYVKVVTDNAKNALTIVGDIWQMLDKHKEVFIEENSKRREAIVKLLDERKWKPVGDLVKQAQPPGNNP